MPVLQFRVARIIDSPISPFSSRKGIGAHEVTALTAIHRLERHHVAPRRAVVAYLQRADVRKRLETIPRKLTFHFQRALHRTVTSLALGVIIGCDMAHFSVLAIGNRNQRNVADISFRPADSRVTALDNPMSVAAHRSNRLGTGHPLHGMFRVYPSASCTIAVRDIQFKRKSRPLRLGSSQSQMPPPFWREGILGTLSLCILCMVLVIVHHTAKPCIPKRLHIGPDALIRCPFVAKEPPRLHAIFPCRLLP